MRSFTFGSTVAIANISKHFWACVEQSKEHRDKSKQQVEYVVSEDVGDFSGGPPLGAEELSEAEGAPDAAGEVRYLLLGGRVAFTELNEAHVKGLAHGALFQHRRQEAQARPRDRRGRPRRGLSDVRLGPGRTPLAKHRRESE